VVYLLRKAGKKSVAILFALLLGASVVAPVGARPTPARATNTSLATATEAAINRTRIAQGLSAFRHNDTLAQMAQAYAERMGKERFFSHTDPQGKTISDRAASVSYDFASLGENLAQVKITPGKEIDYVVAGWMNSPAHRTNICCTDFIESAVGVYCAPDGTLYLVQVFGSPF